MPVSKEDLRTVLTARYDRENWKALVTDLFTDQSASVNWLQTPSTKDIRTKAGEYCAKNLLLLGEITLSDGKSISVYESEVHKASIGEMRVGLRNLIKQEIVGGVRDSAFAVFHSPQQEEWRFTFLSKHEAVDAESGRLKKVETQPKRFTYVLGPTESTRTAEERFYELGRKERSLVNVINAFSVAKISTEFFDEYKEHYEAFTDYLTHSKYRTELFKIPRVRDAKKNEVAEKPIRDFVKKLLGRVVFLYFLQKKGWLGVPEKDEKWEDGDRRFIRSLLDACAKRKGDFYQDYLCPLFFHTLNNEKGKEHGLVFKAAGRSFHKAPYLNGGLFDEDFPGVEQLSFKHTLFEELIGFFDSCNFTIVEDVPDEREIAVDPEMLGHVFESLIEDNKAKGTFYTPKEVVHFMSQESIFLYLATSLGLGENDPHRAQLQRFVRFKEKSTYIEDKAPRIDKLLDEVRICDPAIGSGAFPMGMLLELYELKRKLFDILDSKGFGKDFLRSEVKESIIRKNIYGVDIDKGAIDIACLRFWLSLMVDANKPRALPNLDYKFMQGDSLREDFEGIELQPEHKRWQVTLVKQEDLFGNVQEPQVSIFDFLIGADGEPISVDDLEHQLFDTHEQDKKRHIRKQLTKAEQQWIKHSIDRQIRDHERRIEVAAEKCNQDVRHVSAAQASTIRARHEKDKGWMFDELEELKAKGKRLKELDDYTKPYFLWHLYFKHVFDAGGFDIVVANPPYKEDSAYDDVKKRYGLGKNDLYGMFTAMAVQKLLKPETGVMAFITSDTWLTIGTHLDLRKQLMQRELHKVIRLHKDTFTATVNACVFTLVNRSVKPPAWWNQHQLHVVRLREALTKAKKKSAAVQEKSRKKKQTEAMKVEGVSALEKELADAEALFANLSSDWKPGGHPLITADLTNLDPHKELPAFRDVMYCLEDHVGEVNARYAVYQYPQDLVFTCHNLPLFAANPEHFTLVQDMLLARKDLREVQFNGATVTLRRLGDYAEINQGLSTGDLGYYVRRVEAGEGLAEVDPSLLLTDKELKALTTDEKLNGVDPLKYGGRHFIPYDKGGSSDTDAGWLPNYYVPPKFFINWSRKSLKRLRTMTIAARKKENGELDKIKPGDDRKIASALRNQDKWFVDALGVSTTGKYSPTFRLSYGSVAENTSSTVVLKEDSKSFMLGVLCSKLNRYLSKAFMNHTVHTQESDVQEMVVPLHSDAIAGLVDSIIAKQRREPMYNYLAAEQRVIDEFVYEAYGLGERDIDEVETWFARTYPKLARYADIRPKPDFKKRKELEQVVRDAIAQSENKWVEFKSSLRWDIKQSQPAAHIEHSAMKTVAGFLNGQGGTLLIGVDDEDKVLGLEQTDYKSFPKDKPHDSWSKHWDNTLRNYFGDSVHTLVTCELVRLDDRTVALVHIPARAPKPVWLINKSKNDAEELYIRRMGSTVELKGKELEKYLKG
ncbi:MAG: putative DNA binding domain-containing protein [Flavobacteriales bacterium]|nr:putative DNA binding domain-containing protein [Flavobacteriales bacterium]